MGKLSKQVLICGAIASISASNMVSMPKTAGLYDMRPKNSFRGGSRGKGGKIKYARR